MRRRPLLALLAGLATTGCVSDVPSDGDVETPDTDGGVTATDDPGSLATDDPSTPFETVDVGDRETVTGHDDTRPHLVDVTNAADRARDIAVRVVRDDGTTEVVLERTVSVPAGGEFPVRLLVPGRYRVTVAVPADGRTRQFEIARERFDCNSSGHDVTVPPSDPLDVSVWSAAVARDTPTDD